MQPWEEAVRYKSCAGFSVEICIPDRIVSQIEEQRPLQSLLNLHDLQIDVGETVINRTVSGMGVPVRSVLCTGTVEDIEVVRNKFSQLRDRLAALDDGDVGMIQQGEGNNAILQHQRRTVAEDPGSGQTIPQVGSDDNNPPLFRRKPMLANDDVESKQHTERNGVGTQVWRRTGERNSQHPASIGINSLREKRRRGGKGKGNGNGNGLDPQLAKSLQAIETFVTEMRQQRQDSHAAPEPRKSSRTNGTGVSKTKHQHEASDADSHNGSYQTIGRAESHNRVASETSVKSSPKQNSVRTDRGDPDGYCLEVEAQKRLTSDPQEVLFYWPDGFAVKLREIELLTRTKIRNSTSFTRIKGQLANVERARRFIQSIANETCDAKSIPRRELKETMAPTKYAEAKILDEKRRQENKRDTTKMALRPLMHPVVLVVASTHDIDTHSTSVDYFRGVTVSSLTSVTMAPVPILSFNIRLPSRTWDAIQSNATICISLLEASTEGAAIAHAFTQPHKDPTKAFRDLRQLGYVLRNYAHINIKRLLKVHHSGMPDLDTAVFASIVAIVKPDSCVKVGDHVIVVAEVVNTLMSDRAQQRATAGQSFGLAYANREYRTLGGTIEPMRIPEQDASQIENDSVAAEGFKNMDESQTAAELGRRDVDELVHLVDASRNEVHEQPFVSDHATDNMHLIHEQTASSAEKTKALGKEDLTSLPTTQTLVSPNVEQIYQSLEQMEAAGAVDHDTPATHHKSSSKVAPAQPKRTNTPGNSTSASRPSATSPMSFIRRMWRAYSTSTKPSIPNEAHPQTSTTLGADGFEAKVSDKSLLSTTAGEYINSHDDDYYVPRRMRAMMKAKKQVHDVSKQLERSLANGTLKAEESERLENIISRNEQWLAKKLAFNSAYDLRLMLDKGKVDVKRAQWLESSIEKGQAVLLQEVRQIRTLFDGGKLDETKYKIAKEDLEKDNQILATEAMRLRQMVDEEADDSGAAPESARFDGFKGNL